MQHVARPLKARFWATGDLVVSVEAYKSHFHPRHRRSVSQYVCASLAQASTAPVVRVVTVRNRNNVNVSTTQKFEYYSNYTNEKPQFEHYVQIQTKSIKTNWKDCSQSSHLESTQHIWEDLPVLLLTAAVPTIQCSTLRNRSRAPKPVYTNLIFIAGSCWERCSQPGKVHINLCSPMPSKSINGPAWRPRSSSRSLTHRRPHSPFRSHSSTHRRSRSPSYYSTHRRPRSPPRSSTHRPGPPSFPRPAASVTGSHLTSAQHRNEQPSRIGRCLGQRRQLLYGLLRLCLHWWWRLCRCHASGDTCWKQCFQHLSKTHLCSSCSQCQ